MTRPRLTIKDVAAAAGVSTQTVSRVLNNRPDVAPETFERVQRVIADTGYSPNMLARGLTQGRSQTLGVVAYGLEYFGPSRILTGIDQEAAETDYSITLNLLHDVRRRRRRGPAEHALLAAGRRDHLGDSRGRREPTLVTDDGPGLPDPDHARRRNDRPGLASRRSRSTTSRSGGSRPSTCIAGGARRIGIITGPLDWWEAQERTRGWRRRAGGQRASSREIASSSRATGRRTAGRTSLRTGWSPTPRTLTPCSRRTTRWRSAFCTPPTRWGGPCSRTTSSVVGVDNIAGGVPLLAVAHDDPPAAPRRGRDGRADDRRADR